ncbi:MAG: shikimate dehydrogenase [Myxococcota bacterium]
MTITGHTQLVGLIGASVTYSLSLRMHNGAFHALGMDWAYLPLPVRAGNIGDAVRGLRALSFVGANVTMPYKEQVIEHLDEMTEAAARMGAVNTIHHVGGRLIGDNTDADGFMADLAAHDVDPAGRMALILGAGGAARAVAHALHQRGARLRLTNRTRSRADALAKTVGGTKVVDWTDRGTVRADLIVNCTPVGMLNRIGESPWPGPLGPDQTVVDLIYTPQKTALLKQAQDAGALAIGGLGMLVQQAALSFARWTDRSPPTAVMRATLENL